MKDEWLFVTIVFVSLVVAILAIFLTPVEVDISASGSASWNGLLSLIPIFQPNTVSYINFTSNTTNVNLDGNVSIHLEVPLILVLRGLK